MDTSDTYIKMCDCPEVQRGHTKIELKSVFQGFFVKIEGRDKNTWLPRQDQIQEMCEYTEPFDLLEDFWLFAAENWTMITYPHTKENETWEIMWLSFFMHLKHKKEWDGKTWKAF